MSESTPHRGGSGASAAGSGPADGHTGPPPQERTAARPWDAEPQGHPGEPQGGAPGQPDGWAPAAYAGYGGQMGPARTTNTLAIVSLVSAILGVTFVPLIGSIVGVITGHMARRQIADTGEDGGSAATAGLVIGYVGIGLLVLIIIAVLAFAGLALFAVTLPTTTTG